MSLDEGEKFYMDYWLFEGELEQSQLLDTGISLRARDEDEEARLLANASAIVSFRPPFALHTEDWSDSLGLDLRARNLVEGRDSPAVLAMLTKRGFQCPTGTTNCTDAGFPNSCCPTTETCYPIQE
jgi:progranulin